MKTRDHHGWCRQMHRSLLITISLLLLAAGAAHPAPPAPRPYGGCGVLALKPAAGAERSLLPLYEEPGVHRIAELPGSALPRLAGSSEEPLVSASAHRGDWIQVAYDNAGRKGWLQQTRDSDYLPWREFLPGRQVRILPGMKKGYYKVMSSPGEGSPERGWLTRDQPVTVLQVEDDWARLQAPQGWFRWRDGDGRLTISLHEPQGAEKP